MSKGWLSILLLTFFCCSTGKIDQSVPSKINGASLVSHGKPMLFTEYGYQSTGGAAGQHWNIDQSRQSVNMEAQANAYQALFNTFWGENWFAGGFFWKWHLTEGHGGPDNADFTPQGKAAAKVIQKHYGHFKD